MSERRGRRCRSWSKGERRGWIHERVSEVQEKKGVRINRKKLEERWVFCETGRGQERGRGPLFRACVDVERKGGMYGHTVVLIGRRAQMAGQAMDNQDKTCPVPPSHARNACRPQALSAMKSGPQACPSPPARPAKTCKELRDLATAVRHCGLRRAPAPLHHIHTQPSSKQPSTSPPPALRRCTIRPRRPLLPSSQPQTPSAPAP